MLFPSFRELAICWVRDWVSLHTLLHNNFFKNYLCLSGAETPPCCLGDVLQVPLLWTSIINSVVLFVFCFLFCCLLFSFTLWLYWLIFVLFYFCTCYLLFLYYAHLTCWSNLPWTLLFLHLQLFSEQSKFIFKIPTTA